MFHEANIHIVLFIYHKQITIAYFNLWRYFYDTLYKNVWKNIVAYMLLLCPWTHSCEHGMHHAVDNYVYLVD